MEVAISSGKVAIKKLEASIAKDKKKAEELKKDLQEKKKRREELNEVANTGIPSTFDSGSHSKNST
jgi:hypothetical protein